MGYSEWEAAIAAGATLDELYKWDSGGYTRSFKVKVLAWYSLHSLVEAHRQEAAEDKRIRDAKLRR